LDALLPFSPPTIPQARRYFFTEQRATPWGPGDTPAPSLTPTLNLRVAARLQELGVPHADTWQEHQRIALALNNYFTTYPELASPRDHKLRTTFRQAHVKSGRLSTERFQVHAMPKKLNLPPLNGQRIPELRTLILTPPHRTRYIVDLSQAELRIAASIAHCKPMFDLLSTPNGDVHSQAATQIFGITPSTTTPEDWKAKRDLAKRTVFGSLFGVGPKTFQASLYQATGIILPIEEVTEIINAFNRAYPHYRNEYYKWKAFVENHGYVPLIDGSLSWFHPDRDWPRAGWNRRVQGSLAIYVREWLPAVDALSQGSLVGTVHDSAIFDLPTDEAPQILESISEYTTRSWYDMFGIRGGCDATPW
jgi:DNA polymerase I-like protein with 3'-5' exonuclease and polymerase domains